MRIQASMGRLPKDYDMHEKCWRVTLTADNEDKDLREKELSLLAALYLEARDGNIGYWCEKMRKARLRDAKKADELEGRNA